MPVERPSDVYREQSSSLYHGLEESDSRSTTVNPSIDASDFLPCPPMPGHLPLDVPVPRSDSEKPSHRKRRAQTDQHPMVEGSVGHARSHSWAVVTPSLFRGISGVFIAWFLAILGRRPAGPPPFTTDASPPPQLTPSNWCDLAHWAYRPSDHFGGKTSTRLSSNSCDHSLPPLPRHLSHLPAPSAPLLRSNSSACALNPFLVHNPTGVPPPLSWDLCTSAHSILFPTSSSGPGLGGATPPPAVLMTASDYAQPATWPPCGALQIAAIGGQPSWRWPVDVRNPVGVRCGDVFAALDANLHQFVRPLELADMPSERVALVAAASASRVRAQLPPSTDAATVAAAARDDGIRRVDCLLGHTQFRGLEPGPSPGEWTMYVDNYVDMP